MEIVTGAVVDAVAIRKALKDDKINLPIACFSGKLSRASQFVGQQKGQKQISTGTIGRIKRDMRSL
jgi:hypothetical protein